jgi:polyhydroxyalkanoate synthesis repressor PhaR
MTPSDRAGTSETLVTSGCYASSTTMTRFVKRYANRKLYDIRASRYVSLEDLAEVIQGGEAIAVKDAATGGDLTSVTLAQIILERERSCRGATLPPMLLHQLVRYGARLQELETAAGDGQPPDPPGAPDVPAGELERLAQQLLALEERMHVVERHLQPPRRP